MRMLVGLGIRPLAWIKAKEAWLAPFLLSFFSPLIALEAFQLFKSLSNSINFSFIL